MSTLHLPSCVATGCWCCGCTHRSEMSTLTTAMHFWPVATAKVDMHVDVKHFQAVV